MFIKIKDLVGKTNILVDWRSRINGIVLYPVLYPDPINIRLTKIEYKIITKIKWLEWHWTPEDLKPWKGWNCGYSGITGKHVENYEMDVLEDVKYQKDNVLIF